MKTITSFQEAETLDVGDRLAGVGIDGQPYTLVVVRCRCGTKHFQQIERKSTECDECYEGRCDGIASRRCECD